MTQIKIEMPFGTLTADRVVPQAYTKLRDIPKALISISNMETTQDEPHVLTWEPNPNNNNNKFNVFSATNVLVAKFLATVPEDICQTEYRYNFSRQVSVANQQLHSSILSLLTPSEQDTFGITSDGQRVRAINFNLANGIEFHAWNRTFSEYGPAGVVVPYRNVFGFQNPFAYGGHATNPTQTGTFEFAEDQFFFAIQFSDRLYDLTELISIENIMADIPNILADAFCFLGDKLEYQFLKISPSTRKQEPGDKEPDFTIQY